MVGEIFMMINTSLGQIEIFALSTQPSFRRAWHLGPQLPKIFWHLQGKHEWHLHILQCSQLENLTVLGHCCPWPQGMNNFTVKPLLSRTQMPLFLLFPSKLGLQLSRLTSSNTELFQEKSPCSSSLAATPVSGTLLAAELTLGLLVWKKLTAPCSSLCYLIMFDMSGQQDHWKCPIADLLRILRVLSDSC